MSDVTEKIGEIIDNALPRIGEARESYARACQGWSRHVEDLLRKASSGLNQRQGFKSRVASDSNRRCEWKVHVDPVRLSDYGDADESEYKYTLRVASDRGRRSIVVTALGTGSRSLLFEEAFDPREFGYTTAEEQIARFVEAICGDLERQYRPAQ